MSYHTVRTPPVDTLTFQTFDAMGGFSGEIV
jgi:hypothetical protein